MSAPRTVPQLTYTDLRDVIAPLAEIKWRDVPPVFLPFYNPQLLKSPLPYVILNVGGGSGLSKDGTFDRPFINVRTVSRSQDSDGAEELTLWLDTVLLSFDSSGIVGGLALLYITRTGGRPQLLMLDDAERYHFTATYITEVESGLG